MNNINELPFALAKLQNNIRIVLKEKHYYLIGGGMPGLTTLLDGLCATGQ